MNLTGNLNTTRSSTLFSILTLFVIISSGFAQPREGGGMPGGTITGSVVDSLHHQPIEYATILLFSKVDSSQVTGTSTNSKGEFSLTGIRPGGYFAQVSFIGFSPKTINDLRISREKRELDIGAIALSGTSLTGDEVTVIGEKSPIEYHLDKKIINVSKMQTAVSGSAVDVLENAPSITVDIEGNVSLRGSQNFTVLIDGRPSVLDANDALEQTPAAAIETIEIITNPSAKYDPEGTSGIINIILLKNRSAGVSGIINTNAGILDKRGGDILLSRRANGLVLTAGADYGRMRHPGSSRSEDRTIVDGTTFTVLSEGDRKMGPIRYGGRMELEWGFSSKDTWSVGLRAGSFHGEHAADLSHDEWSDEDNIHHLYSSSNPFDRRGDYLAAFTSFTHQFAPKGNELKLEGNFNNRTRDDTSANELYSQSGELTSGHKTAETGPNSMLELKADYSRELTADRKLETGFEGRYGNFEDDNVYSEYDTLQNAYVIHPEFSHEVDYSQDIHAAYATYSDKIGPASYMLGLRGEYMYRKIGYAETNEDFVVDRWDYFPSTHLSFALGGVKQLMTSYSRRIQRSRRVDGWVLQPFLTWEDAYNVRRGNPSLEPEFIDSYELGYQTAVLGNFLSLEGYYRITNNRVEFLRSAYAENITLSTVDNVGKDYSLGVECQLNTTIRKWWDMNLTGNVYDYRVKSDLSGSESTQKTFTWNSRVNNILKLNRSWRIQLDGMYSGPSVTSQGTREGFFAANAAIKYSIIESVLTATLQARDVFATAARESTSSGVDFYSYSYMERDAPDIMLNISFNINNYKKKPGENGNSEDVETGSGI